MSSQRPVVPDRIVANATLELRRGPDHRSECVTEMLMGSRLRVLEECDEGRWLLVLAPDGYRAWARGWGTVPLDPVWPRAGVFLSCLAETIREKPEAGAMSLAPVVLGCRLELRSGTRRGWRRVMTPDRRNGWLPARSISSDSLPMGGRFWEPPRAGGPRPGEEEFARASVSRIVERGRSLAGAPYRWGGFSPFGIDCSGFIRLVFGLDGIGFPRDAKDQAEALRRFWVTADLDRLRAGDLVFFGPDDSTIDHVAMALGGRGGKVVHASGRVRFSGLVPGLPAFERELAGRVRRIARPPWSPGP